MYSFELISVISTLMTAMALLIIAWALLFGLTLYRRQQRILLKARTYEMLEESLHWRVRISSLVQKIKGREVSRDTFVDDVTLYTELREVLNHCEYVSLSVRHEIYDAEMIRDAYATLFVLLYSHVERMIHESRYESNDPNTYGAFTAIVKKWQHDSRLERSS